MSAQEPVEEPAEGSAQIPVHVSAPPGERYITSIDPWRSIGPLFPLLRWAAPRSVERMLLRRALRPLLASGQWELLTVRQKEPDDGRLYHQYDVFGKPAPPRRRGGRA